MFVDVALIAAACAAAFVVGTLFGVLPDGRSRYMRLR